MTKQKEPTLKELLRDIYTKQGQHDTLLTGILEQAQKTNGRVTRLENIESNRSAVEAYKDKEGFKTPSEEKDGWTNREKALISIIMAMLALASAVVGGVLR